jgi:hypothetical protein
VARWFLLLQEFNILILDKPGKENVILDLLSRNTSEGDHAPVQGTFLDENLSSLSINTPWFAYIAN